jgi:hypothetical protein
MEIDDVWTAHTTPAEMRSVIERFLELHRATLPVGCPLTRWLAMLDEAGRSRDSQTPFVTSLGDDDQRRAHDVIEAQRLAWSLLALYAPGRRRPDIDGSFITRRLLGVDDPGEPTRDWHMPVGTFLINFAARLQQAEGGRIRICGDGSEGVDLIYTRDNGGMALIELKEAAYRKSRSRDLEPLIRHVRGRVFAAAEGLRDVTHPQRRPDGSPVRAPLVGARVVVVGTSPALPVAHQFYDASPDTGHSMMARVMTTWQMDLSRRDPNLSPHAMLIFCMAHDIEPTTMVSAALGRFVDFGLVGGGECDDHWRRVSEVFQKTVSRRA